MIISIDKNKFNNLIKKEFLELPIRWDGRDFYDTLSKLFKEYKELFSKDVSPEDLKIISEVCKKILKCIDEYHKGFPSESFKTFAKIMEKLYKYPLKIYPKTDFSGAFKYDDPLKLYRIRNVSQNTSYERKDIFHTPYNLRSKIPTYRYSISGYPSLYLATSLDLCLEECKLSDFNQFTIASLFKLDRDMESNNGTVINVIELGIKPSDFIKYNIRSQMFDNRGCYNRIMHLKEIDLSDPHIMGKYLYWYPLIASCSFLRANKMDSFASEYIVPQLLMQWVRLQYKKRSELIGIRYFSCASYKASEMGFNYVFPVSGEKDSKESSYCDVLAKSFKLTKPHFTNEYFSSSSCEDALKDDDDINYI